MQRPWKMIAVAAALTLSATAAADAPDQELEEIAEAVEPAMSAEADEVLDLTAFEDAGALSDDELGSQRAREDIGVSLIVINDQEQDGDVTDNVAIGNTNGDNLINGDAFSNSSGFLSTVQNTGNNVLIQNSTIINVSVDTPSTD